MENKKSYSKVSDETKRIIGKQLNSALALKNVKQKDLAKELNVDDNTISYFCSGKRMPNVEQIVLISKMLNVSTDFLLGLTNVSTNNNKDLRFICDYTGLDETIIKRLHSISPDNQMSLYGKYYDTFGSNYSVILNELILWAIQENLEKIKDLSNDISGAEFKLEYETPKKINEILSNNEIDFVKMEMFADVLKPIKTDAKIFNGEISDIISQYSEFIKKMCGYIDFLTKYEKLQNEYYDYQNNTVLTGTKNEK